MMLITVECEIFFLTSILSLRERRVILIPSNPLAVFGPLPD